MKEEANVVVTSGSALMTWLVRHVGTLLTRVKVNKATGLTAYEEMKGKESNAPLIPFGESILYIPSRSKTERQKIPKMVLIGCR